MTSITVQYMAYKDISSDDVTPLHIVASFCTIKSSYVTLHITRLDLNNLSTWPYDRGKTKQNKTNQRTKQHKKSKCSYDPYSPYL